MIWLVRLGWVIVLLHSPLWAQSGKPGSAGELAGYRGADREAILVEGAKKEGKVLWYTSLTGGPNLEIPKAFEAKYPGVKVEVYRASSDDLLGRILAETQAKRNLVDTVETTFPVLKVMRDYKLLVPYFSPHLAQYPDEVKEKAGQGLVFWATDRESYVGLAYNTNAVASQSAPQSFEDLLKPEFKGRIGFATSDTGSRVIGALLAVKGDSFLKKLKAQEVSLHAVSGRALLDLVVSGEVGVSPTVFLSHSRVSIGKGAPIKWLPMDVVPTNAGGVVISAHAPHPHGALLLADFLLGPDGQRILGKFGLDSAVNKPDFKRWYPEQGLTTEQYEKESNRWDKWLREIGRKS